MDKWKKQIDELGGSGCHWSGLPQDQREISDLLKGVGGDPDLDPHDISYLLDQVKRHLGCPKNVSEELVKAAAAEAFPPPPLPDGWVEASEQPVDLQAAELIFQEHFQLIAERSWTLFRYAHDQGFWGVWPDTPAKKTAQQSLQTLAVNSETGWARPHGSANQIKATVDQLKVLTSGGPFSEARLPTVMVFRNGTFNLKTHQLEQHNPENWATYGLAADYMDMASCPEELQAVIDRCYPPEAEPIVRAIIRWAVDPTIRYGEAFHIIGDSGTGKGLLIDFIRSLFPPNVIGQLMHPADLSSPEKVHQYVVGKRLVAFPDAPANLNRRDGDSCNLFYELVENKPVTTRKLFAGESEESRPMHCRFILGSVRPLNFKDGRDGYLRRVITLNTLPRSSAPDTTLREQLNRSGGRFDEIRAEAISWALAMPLETVNAVLNRDDPMGLLRDAAQEAAVASDIVNQWADQCLEPSLADLPVTQDDWVEMYDCFRLWAEYEGVRALYINRRANFIGQVRKILGPDRCLPRQTKAKYERELDNSSARWWPALDAGFRLRPGIFSPGLHNLPGTTLAQGSFRASALKEGGLAELARLQPACRTGHNGGGHTRGHRECTGHSHRATQSPK